MGEIECEHDRTFTIRGKAGDRITWSYNDRIHSDPDYAPEIEGLCGGDYIEVKVCLQCHVLIGFSSDDVDDLLIDVDDDEIEDEELDEDEEDDTDLDFDESDD